MRRRSKAGGGSAKAQRRKAAARKSRIAPKGYAPSSFIRYQPANKGRRAHRELKEAIQQQRATVDVLKDIPLDFRSDEGAQRAGRVGGSFERGR
jgi:hypothetical protein